MVPIPTLPELSILTRSFPASEPPVNIEIYWFAPTAPSTKLVASEFKPRTKLSVYVPTAA